MSQLLHKVSRGLFSSFKQLLDQMLPECACWIGGSRKPFAACAVWSLTKLNFTIYSLSALSTLFIESCTGYLLLTAHKVCFTQLASAAKMFCCNRLWAMTEKAKWEMGVRDAVRCWRRGKWLSCSQSPARNRVPRHQPSSLRFADFFFMVCCASSISQHFQTTENLCLWSDISEIPSLSSLKLQSIFFMKVFFSSYKYSAMTKYLRITFYSYKIPSLHFLWVN